MKKEYQFPRVKVLEVETESALMDAHGSVEPMPDN